MFTYHTRRPGRARGLAATILCVLISTSSAPAERIELIGPSGVVQAGMPVSVLVVLRENTTNLVGYSLNVDVNGVVGSMGSVSADPTASNFFPSRNLIEQDPDDALDSIFSIITDPGDGGVFVNAQSQSGQPVDLALPGFSDVLAEVVFDTSSDAFGLFEISLGPATTLFDGANSVAFDSPTLSIQVVPEPHLALWIGGVWLALRRRGWSERH
jgi:hypothetical protein